MFAKIGSLSSSTNVVHEIASNLAIELEMLANRDTDEERVKATLPVLAAYKKAMAEGDDAALQSFVDQGAEEAFQPYLAPYTSFRSWSGEDGNSFGIQPDLEMLMEDARFQNGVVQIDAGDPVGALPEDIDYIVSVNDHGNVSLYDARTGQELWACV
jgi:hypothetical protein